jgi:hypothetical protein
MKASILRVGVLGLAGFAQSEIAERRALPIKRTAPLDGIPRSALSATDKRIQIPAILYIG